MDRTSAVKALAEDFCDYMEDLIHKKQVAGNASNSAQQTMGTSAAVQAAAQGADPVASRRIAQLEVQLAKAQHTIQRMQANAAPKPPTSITPPKSTSVAPRGKTLQEQIDQLMEEVGPPTDAILPETIVDVEEVPESIPASQDTVIFSPSGRPVLDQEMPSPADPAPNPKRKLVFPSPSSDHATAAKDAPTQATQASQASATTRPPAKRLRQSTLTGKQTPVNSRAGAIFEIPNQPSPWFTANYTGVHTESGITRWFGSLKNPREEENRGQTIHRHGLQRVPQHQRRAVGQP